jgi:putative membrane-bound dehydrogenase-like protein
MAALLLLLAPFSATQAGDPIRLLFLGDNGHHQPAARAEQLIPVLAERGIQVEYTNDVKRLKPTELDAFRGLIIYANIESITPEQEDSLINYVERGGGLIALHCASYCFLNSPRYVDLVGAQFKTHETGTFTTEIAEAHPVMSFFHPFMSWDETYVHHRHNTKDRTVLEYRVQGVQAEGQKREPWTWVRNQGKGRVFYTAWGHDQRTWSHPGFHELVERGIRWSVGEDPSKANYPPRDPKYFNPPAMTLKRTDVAPFEYVDVGAKIPNYTPSERWGTQGQPQTKMQKPLSPEESAKHFVTPRGWEMKLLASEENLVGKPIAMNWDEKGRLWVIVTIDYPNDITERGAGNDKIQILEDTNNDGKAVKFTLFADKLNIATSLVCVDGGAIVQNGTETLFLKDTDGDGSADVRHVLLTGWGLGDTHGGVSNLRYGPDNWIWGMQGYNASTPTADGKVLAKFQMGFFRMKFEPGDPPKITAVEFLRSTYGNTWGLGFSEEGLVFGSSANGHPSLFMPIPNRYYEGVRGWTPPLLAASIAESPRFYPITDKVRQVDHHGNYSAAAGHALCTSSNYGSSWRNKTALVCGPEGHLVGMFVLDRDGAGYKSVSPCNLVASDDEWSAPIMAEVGPDGYIWIIDWYNYIVQHNPTPIGFENGKGNAYVSDLRDKKHGRIYRLFHDAHFMMTTCIGPRRAPSLDAKEPRYLTAAMKYGALTSRLDAQRLLVARGKRDIVPELLVMARDQEVDEIGLNVGAMHALWTLSGLGVIQEDEDEVIQVVAEALAHPSAGVRRAALMTLPPSEKTAARIIDRKLLTDSDAQVKLAAMLALADAPASTKAGQALAEVALLDESLRDPVLKDALIAASATHTIPFIDSLATMITNQKSPSAEVTSSLPGILAIVAEHAIRTGLDDDATSRLLATSTTFPPTMAEGLLAGITKGWPVGQKKSLAPEAEANLLSLYPKLAPSGRTHLIRLGNLTGNPKLLAAADDLIRDAENIIQENQAPTDQRLNAVRQLIELRPARAESVQLLLSQIQPQAEPEWVGGILQSLRNSTSNQLGEEILARIGSFTPNAQQQAIRLLLARTDTTRDLLKGIEKGVIDLTDLPIDQRQALSAHPDKMIAARASKLFAAGGGLPNPDRAKVLDELMPLVQKSGDVARGKIAFKTHCAKCHQHGNEGENIGPNLSGMAVHPKSEILLNIVDPSRSVETNYRAYTLTTVDGRVQTGLLAAESKTTVEMVDAEGKRLSIPREDIEELLASKKSFMPEGFEKQMKPQEIVDLLEFMTARGKYTPLDLRPVATIVSTKGMFTAESADVERLIFDDWSPKTVDGVPYLLVDPKVDRIPNVVMLKGDLGEFPPRMPTSVTLPVGQSAKRFHFLSGVGGWSFPATGKDSVSMIVRIHYANQESEEHQLLNGVHFADYIRRVDVPGSKLAFMLRGQQIRTFSIEPKSTERIDRIELVKGPDPTAPVVMAITAEAP